MKKKYKLEDLVKKGYYYVNSNITSQNFPQPEIVEINGWKVIDMKKSFSSEEALAEIKRQGCRPANIYELALWKQNHEKTIQKGKGYLAFGSVWFDGDYHNMPCVHRCSDGDFRFDFGLFEIDWNGDRCLLCFCDKTLDTVTLENRVKELEQWQENITKALAGVIYLEKK